MRVGESRAGTLLSAVGIAAVVAGLAFLAPSSIGLDWATLPGALAERLSITVPGTILVTAAAALNIAAGAVSFRALSGRPCSTWSEAVLGGFVVAVLIDVALMAALGALDLFVWVAITPAITAAVGIGLLGRGRLTPFVRRLSSERQRPAVPMLFAALLWMAPLVLLLAAPIVTWNDVPANHVAPSEHLRTFGSLDPLTTSPSPRYAASRNFLGYIAFEGTLATVTDLSAARTVVSSVPVFALVLALASMTFTAALFGRGAGRWALLTVPLTFVFLRLPDGRATVAAVPIALFALAWLVKSRRGRNTRDQLVMAASLGAAALMHPLIGAFAIATTIVLVLIRPYRFATNGIPGALGAGVLALPQLAVMLDVRVPSAAGLVAILAAPALVVATQPLGAPRAIARTRGAIATVTAGLVVLSAGTAGAGAWSAIGTMGSLFPLLAVTAAGSAVLLRRRRRALLVVVAVMGAWLVGVAVAAVVPVPQGLRESLEFELPKSYGYWVPMFLAILTAGGLSRLADLSRYRSAAYAALVALFLVVAALPIRSAVVHPSELGERRYAESLSIAASFAQRGYWQGYPDARFLIDAASLEVIGVLRSEQRSGRLGPGTRVLHVARESAEGAQIPIGVFSGALEWLASEEPDRSIHVDASRQPHAEDVPRLVGPEFPYIVVEPAGLTFDPEEAIDAAGYATIFSNDRAIVYRRP